MVLGLGLRIFSPRVRDLWVVPKIRVPLLVIDWVTAPNFSVVPRKEP